MSRIHFKQIIRSFWKYKQFSLINLLGLSLGMAAAFMIFLIARYEESFDLFHSDPDAMFRVVKEETRTGKQYYDAGVPYPMARSLRSEYPGLLASQIHYA